MYSSNAVAGEVSRASQDVVMETNVLKEVVPYESEETIPYSGFVRCLFQVLDSVLISFSIIVCLGIDQSSTHTPEHVYTEILANLKSMFT